MRMSCHACPHSVRTNFEQAQMSVSPSRQQQGQQQWQSSMLVCFQLSRNTVCADCSNCDIAAAVNSTARMRIIFMVTRMPLLCVPFPPKLKQLSAASTSIFNVGPQRRTTEAVPSPDKGGFRGVQVQPRDDCHTANISQLLVLSTMQDLE